MPLEEDQQFFLSYLLFTIDITFKLIPHQSAAIYLFFLSCVENESMYVLFNFASLFSPLCRHSLIKTGLLLVIHFLIGWECHLSLELAMCLSSYLGSLQLAISHHHPCASHQEPLRCNLQLHLTRITPTTILPFFCRLIPYFRFRLK